MQGVWSPSGRHSRAQIRAIRLRLRPIDIRALFFFEIHRPKFRLLTCRSCMIFMNGLEDNGGYFDICFLAILKLKKVSKDMDVISTLMV
jgi:hypothetical protein